MRAAFAEFTFDDETRQLLRNGEPVPVPARVFDLLGVLLTNRPRAISKSDLMDILWPKTFVSESNLAGLVNDLRAALGDDARRPTWIRTVYGFGYAFMGGGVAAKDAALSFARHRLLWSGREVGLRDGGTVLGRDESADPRRGRVSLSSARADRGARRTRDARGSREQERHLARRDSRHVSRDAFERRRDPARQHLPSFRQRSAGGIDRNARLRKAPSSGRSAPGVVHRVDKRRGSPYEARNKAIPSVRVRAND